MTRSRCAGAAARGRPPPLGSFFQEDDGVGFVIFLAEGLLVARLQGRLCAGALREEEHSAVQAVHVELAVYVYAFGPEGGPQVIIDVARPDVFAEEVVARARLDFQEDLFAFYPCEECGVVHNHSFRKISQHPAFALPCLFK